MPKISKRLVETLFELRTTGYSRQDIRDITGLSRQTQWRIEKDQTRNISRLSQTKLSRVDLIESATGISLDQPTKKQLIDIRDKKTASRYFEKYTKPVTRITKVTKSEFKDTFFRPAKAKQIKLKDLPKNKIFYVAVQGEHQRTDRTTKTPYVYSSKGFLRPTEKDVKKIQKFIDQHSKGGFRGYTKSKLQTVIITSVEKM